MIQVFGALFLTATTVASAPSVPSPAAPTSPTSNDERVDRLSEEHKLWLERDVVYIITERERDVFLSLETVEERNRFIEAFWRKRDPNVATPANEFRDEHYRRLEYANTYLGRDTFREGWRTDRGRYYIILGEPREIQRYEGYAGLVSCHLWFYQGDPRMGTPSFFYLLFFKKDDLGEFRLYRPVVDGPTALVTGSEAVSGGNTAALRILRENSAELAAASLSFDPSEPADIRSGRPSIGTEMMLARIEESPKRAIRTDYADAALRYGNRVSSEYTFNFIPSRSAFAVFADPISGTAMVHTSVEIDPENFSIETDEDQSKFYTTLDLTIEARTADGKLAVATDKEAYIEMSPSQMQQIRAQPFAYQDDFPLVAGDYTVTVVVRNRVLSQYTVAEQEVHVPDFETPALTDVVLAYDARTVAGGDPGALRERLHTYQVGELQIYPAAGNLFVLGETAHLVTQSVGASPGHRVVFEILQEDRVVRTLESPVTADGVALVTDSVKLDRLEGGEYRVVARLVSSAGETISERESPLTLSPRSFAARPGFVYRRGVNTMVPGLVSFIRGEQFWNLGRYDEAKEALEDAVAADNQRLAPARWKLANVYLREERADDALRLLKPLEEAFPDQYEVVAGLGFAMYFKGDFAQSVDYLSRARSLAPPDTMLLNALGDSHQRLGNTGAAREAFERSLDLDADQPAVKERLSSMSDDPPGSN